MRRCTLVRAPNFEVWKHFETEQALQKWFGLGHQVEAYTPGHEGHIQLSVEVQGARRSYGGKILNWQANRELSFDNNWEDVEMAWPVSTQITLRLTQVGDETLVELFHHGFELLGESASAQHEAYEAGWNNQHLSALKKLVECE